MITYYQIYYVYTYTGEGVATLHPSRRSRRTRPFPPPGREFFRPGGPAGQWPGTGGAQRLQQQRQVAAAEQVARVGPRQGDRAERLEQQDDVPGAHVGAQRPVALGPLVDRGRQRPGALRQLVQVGGRGERPGQTLGQGLAAAVEDPGQAVGVDRPRVALVGQGALEFRAVADQAVPGQLPGQVLLGRVAPVEGADPDPGSGGDRGDRGGRVGQEDLAGRVQDLDVVAGRLSASPAERTLGVSHSVSVTLERNDPLC